MAQNILICQLCETSNEIKWKCLNCKLTMCESCKSGTHSKIHGSEKHAVIDLKNVGKLETAAAIRNLDLDHDNELCYHICQECATPICSSCLIASNHEGHRFAKLAEVYKEKLTKLKIVEDSIERKSSFFNENIQKIDAALDNYNEIKENIQKKEKELKERVTKEADNIMKKLDDMLLPNDILTERQTMQSRSDDLEQRKDEIDQILHSHSAARILDIPEQLIRDVPMTSAIQTKEKLIFTELHEPIFNFGHLGEKNSILNVCETYCIDKEGIQSIQGFRNGTYLLNYCKHQQNKRYSIYFCFKDAKYITTKEIRVEFESEVYDMTVTEDDDVLLTFKDEKIYNLVEDNIKELFSIAPRLACGIHATHHKTIVVGYLKLGFSSTSRRENSGILVVDMKGNINNIFELDDKNVALVSFPYRITTNVNDDMYIIDREHESQWQITGKIVSLGAKGELRWTYTLPQGTNTNEEFLAADIATTGRGLVISTDYANHKIHVLSPTGELVTSVGKEQGIYFPTCLNINNTGHLQVCNKRHVFDRYGFLEPDGMSKINVLEFSD